MNEKEKPRVKEYEILRVILTIIVVVGHSVYLSLKSNMGGINYLWPGRSIVRGLFTRLHGWIYSFHMPAFFLLSGAVYYFSQKKSLDELAKKKTLRLLIPYFLVGLLYMIPMKSGGGYYDLSKITTVIKTFIVGAGETGHLWFLLSLFWVSIVFYLIKKLLKDKSVFLLLVVCFLIQKYYAVYCPINVLGLKNAMNYLFYYALGYAFQVFKSSHEEWFTNKKITIPSFLLLFGLCVANYFFHFLGSYATIYANVLMLFLFAILIANTPIGNSKLVSGLAKHSMDIYLFHDPLNYLILLVFFQFNLQYIPGGFAILIFLRTVGVIVASILIAKGIKKIKQFSSVKIMS